MSSVDNWSLKPEWQEFINEARTEAVDKIAQSNIVVQLVPDEVDIKVALEVGVAVLLDKPLVVVALPGRQVSEKLALVADEVVHADLETGGKLITDALRRVMEK